MQECKPANSRLILKVLMTCKCKVNAKIALSHLMAFYVRDSFMNEQYVTYLCGKVPKEQPSKLKAGRQTITNGTFVPNF